MKCESSGLVWCTAHERPLLQCVREERDFYERALEKIARNQGGWIDAGELARETLLKSQK